MKRLILILVITICFFSCSSPVNYKQSSVAFLKKQYPELTSVDTIKFLKPDSIYTTFHDTKEYRTLMLALNNFYINADSANIKKVNAAVKEKERTYKNIVTGWDVRLIYKAKNKKGVLKTDTCRFLFDSRLMVVKDLNGVDL
jgi:predicted nucleotide-binding protein (sugar kinase/HSP70/actin superfamily)